MSYVRSGDSKYRNEPKKSRVQQIVCPFRLEGFTEGDIYAVAKELNIWVREVEKKQDEPGFYGYGVVQVYRYHDRTPYQKTYPHKKNDYEDEYEYDDEQEE